MRNINLLPLQYRPEPKFIFKRFATVLLASVVLLTVLGSFIGLRINILSTNKLINSANANIEALENNLLAVDNENSHLQNVRDIVMLMEKIDASYISQVEVFNDLAKHTPPAVTITNASIYPEGIILNGRVSNLSAVSLFLQSLNSWNMYEGFSIPHVNLVEGQYVFQVQGSLRRGE
ncbi:hypothetical protein HYG86_15705 [Alkalicella caledoniensis]|uniref:Uncharacterized protein n=1 Tax=Alkalicella caledoniensis TaxID=2731377 RepID=A0A7G9WBP7_ALKCA|nr:hypothetical protein [Alkalicella caledoniensis]QNO16109.1 hypothetical protein HYG86_15705 [Alkalicella caledoniensis]